ITVSLGVCLFASAACGGRLYKVAPLPAAGPAGSSGPPEISSNNASGNTGGLNVGAVALEGDSALERFDANLPLAGVVAVDVRLENGAPEAHDPAKFKFELRDATGKALKSLTPKKALGAVMKYNGNRFYTLAARQKTRDDYESVALKLAGGIAPREERRGILFFQTDRNTTNLDGLTLSIKGAAAPVSVSVAVR
ncbi:MAG: hypothetical protein ACREEM_29865, partial [Blastocatellia bacterium]